MSVKIRDNETLIEALRRTLGREVSYEDVVKNFGGRFTGQSEVRPRECGGEKFADNNFPTGRDR